MEYNKRAFYGDSSSGSSSDRLPPASSSSASNSSQQLSNPLPPLHTLRLHSPPNSLVFDFFEEEGDKSDYLPNGKASRIRSFPHVKGNYALYVYIPVRIPSAPMKELAQFLKKVSSRVPGLNAIDIDIPLNILCTDDLKLEQASLGREFHISLGRTVPIRRHQIDSVVAMLRQKLQFQSRYWIDFNEWEVFVNDDHTRSFLSIEVKTKGLAEWQVDVSAFQLPKTILLFHTIRKQIQAVNEVYKLHNLPEFYKDPRPHVSLAWALGDISDVLKRVVEGKVRRCTMVGKYAKPRIFTCKFSGIDCKIGNKTYKICKFQEDYES
ncbi:U6 snRNA phosphodiesterase-like isoform X1 [Camellia sinensis]|uniref:U6 snRNA phosphodiesterase-like isoform X1 n=1 Tax=Camellia sinensis TaxID=4442 RepID=UPI0010359228|nr:U6 snRNA phosphodiesterase-like isoform X1 [Camellia sinensis]